MMKTAPEAKILTTRTHAISKNDTITTDIGKTVEEIRMRSIQNDDTSNVHARLAKSDDAKIIETFMNLL